MSDLAFLEYEPDFSSPAVLNAYDELPLWSAIFGMLLFDELPLRGVRMALDVGCGTGFPLIELAERLGAAAHVHGVDPWTAGLARAREKAASRKTPNVTLHEASAVAMPFADGMFDLIVSNLGLNNFDDRAAAVLECRRVSRAGATIALTTNLQGHMQELYDSFRDVLIARKDAAAVERLDAHVEHRATVAGVHNLLEARRYTLTRVVERTATLRFADGTALMNHHFIKLGFLEGWKKIVPGDERAVFTELLEVLNQRAARDGELSLTIPMAYVEAVAS